jgi:integrase
MSKYASEMRLFDPGTGDRLYMNENERERFIKAARALDNRSHWLFCEMVHWTGCRISEALELTPRRIDTDAMTVRFRTLKKNKYTKNGQLKAPVYRDVPLSQELLLSLDLYFNIRKARKTRRKINNYLWPNQADPKRPMDRSTGWRIIKRVLDVAGIDGPQATAKGFRHGYATSMIQAGMSIYELKDRLGHESASTTAIYAQVVGQEAHELQMQYWERANKNWTK